MKQAVFPLREGDAVLELPEHLSKASLDTIKKWIDLVLLQLNVDEQEPKQPSDADLDLKSALE